MEPRRTGKTLHRCTFKECVVTHNHALSLSQIVKNVPMWAHIYYFLRTGHADLALEVASELEADLRNSEQGSASGGFVAYLKAWLSSDDRR